MKLGTCVGAKFFTESLPGYAEIPARELYAMEKERFETLKNASKERGIQVYAANCLTPTDMRLTGEEVNMQTIKSFATEVFDKLAQFGVQMVVFGAGKSKTVPEGFSREKAWDQLFEIGALFSDLAKPYGQTVAVEPLSYNETNIVNTIEDAVFYTNTVNRDNFKYMVDFYHFDNNGQKDASLLENSVGLVHAHIAAPKLRTVPESDEEWAFTCHCLDLLKTIGYKGGLSFEGKRTTTDRLADFLNKLQKETEIRNA